jgi:hypothetical protein
MKLPMQSILAVFLFLAMIVVPARICSSQTLPATPGETLSGRHIVLEDVVSGHAVVLVAGFTRESADSCGAWAKLLRGDPALAGVAVYQVAMLKQAPSFVRGTIKSGLRNGLSTAQQDKFVILTQDDKLWQSYFGVTADKDPYVVLLDDKGQVLWHGHGAAKDLEPQLRAAKR